jgi:hypothetical protein
VRVLKLAIVTRSAARFAATSSSIAVTERSPLMSTLICIVGNASSTCANVGTWMPLPACGREPSFATKPQPASSACASARSSWSQRNCAAVVRAH